MKQNIIKLIALYLLSIFLISCGASNNDNGTNNNQDDKNDNNNPPIINNDDVIFTSSNKISVKENQLNAITLKATGHAPIVYSISGGDSGSFSINSATGVIVFKTKPDYESKTAYNFTATAKNSKNSEDEQNVIISILDEDEKPPLFTSSDTLRIRENTLRVVTVKTKDESMVTYSITNEEDGSKFDINATSGEITFKQAPDYESKTSYSLNIIAKDANDNQSNQNINITILDIKDETKPIWTSSRIVSVDENQLNAITLIATDDSSTITYSISIEYALPGATNAAQVDDRNIFNVGHISGKVTFKKKPDFESRKSYSFIAKATDLEGNEATQNVIISILDVDEVRPIWVSSNTVSVQENQFNAITLKATDENKITYSISGDDSDSFDINNTSGVVFFKQAPDYESKKTSYSFTATAKDSKDNFSTQVINIIIIDIVDEISPKWVSPDTVSVQENQLNVLTLKATDENKITYSISGDDSDSFNIDNAGLITFKEYPNYELNSSYHFISKATDEYGNSNSSNTTVNITFVSKLIETFTGHTGSVHSLAIMNENIISGSGDNTVKIWDINTTRAIKTFTNNTNNTNDILSIAITLDKKNILIGSGDNNIKLLDKDSGELIRIFTGHIDNVHSVIITPDGQSILSAGGYQDKTIRLWEINTSRLKQTFKGHTGGIHALAITPDGQYVLSGSNDDNINLWNINTGALIRTFIGHAGTVSSLAVTKDGQYVLSGSNDDNINLWNINTGALIRTFKGHNGIINAMKITSDGKYVLSGSGDSSIKLWNINTGALIRTFKGHTESVSSVEIIKNGKYVISGSWDHTLKLWDIANL